MIYDPYYDSKNRPVYYTNPYIIIPKPMTTQPSNPALSNNSPTYNAWTSSDPAYKF